MTSSSSTAMNPASMTRPSPRGSRSGPAGPGAPVADAERDVETVVVEVADTKQPCGATSTRYTFYGAAEGPSAA